VPVLPPSDLSSRVISGPLRRARGALLERSVVERTLDRASRRANLSGRFELTDRSRGSDRLAIILAGYKPHLWELTLTRFERFLPADVDVCVLSAGRRVPELEAFAERRGWSYLSTRGNYLSLVQNLAIRAHPAARWIYKFDEDILITEGLCETLLDAYGRVRAEGRYWPGFVAPLINVNGYSYVPFLEYQGIADGYVQRFGPLTHASGQIAATNDGEAAIWLWQHSIPFDEIAARMRAAPFQYSTVPHKFNIGAILLERSLWERIGGFRVRPPAGALGVDESHLCKACIQLSRAMLVSHNAFAGHFAFGPQDAAMRAVLPQLTPHMTLTADGEPPPWRSDHAPDMT